MIRTNMFAREELVDLIKKSPKTKDGYYFFPRFPNLVLLTGKIKDNGYYYDRSIFKDKVCFHDEDLKSFLAKKSTKMDLVLERFIDNKLQEVLHGLENLNLCCKINSKGTTLEELIDTTIYITKYKYGK